MVITMEKKNVKTKKNRRISWKEWTFYAIAILIALFGLSLMITGIIGDNLGVSLENNPIKAAEKDFIATGFAMNFRNLGLVIIALGALVAIITLMVNAKKSDREHEKQLRRQERLSSDSEETKTLSTNE